jgi:hypothetical protein
MSLPPNNAPDSMDDRERALKQDGWLIGIVAMGMLAGMHFSPFFDPAFFVFKLFAPSFFISSPLLLFYFISLLLSTLAIAIGGVAAAIYERSKGLTQSNPTSMMIWFGGVAVLALPSLLRAAKLI